MTKTLNQIIIFFLNWVLIWNRAEVDIINYGCLGGSLWRKQLYVLKLYWECMWGRLVCNFLVLLNSQFHSAFTTPKPLKLSHICELNKLKSQDHKFQMHDIIINKSDIIGEISSCTSFRKWGEILSGPIALVGFRFFNHFDVPSGVIIKLYKQINIFCTYLIRFNTILSVLC
jgi:hypothetical protein